MTARKRGCRGPRTDGASAFNTSDEDLARGLARIRHGEEMRARVKDKEAGWREWLHRFGLWGEDRDEDANYLRYR